MTSGLQDRMTELPHKKRRQPQAHRRGEIGKRQNVTINKNARAQQMEKLIYAVAVGGVMIIVFSLHHFGKKRLQRLWHLDKTLEHFPHETRAHNFLPSRILIRG